jgi:proton-coupled amino acid transporter
VGITVYLYEGVGLVLPIMDTAENPKDYKKIVLGMMCILATLYSAFAFICYYSFGELIETALITDVLNSYFPSSIVIKLVELGFVFSLLVTYPLVIYPANIVLEHVIFG